jgi:N-acetylmuramoyl-L-alanine amidase
MKIGFDLGHGCGRDGGAAGIRAEEDLINEVGTEVIELLREAGHEVIECRPKVSNISVRDSLNARVNTANKAGVEIFISLHFNAFNGVAHGCEIFAISQKGRKIAAPVLSEICKLGFVNRGIRDGSHLRVVEDTEAPAILIEGCFCDSRKDINLYNKDKMVQAIFKGLISAIREFQQGDNS